MGSSLVIGDGARLGDCPSDSVRSLKPRAAFSAQSAPPLRVTRRSECGPPGPVANPKRDESRTGPGHHGLDQTARAESKSWCACPKSRMERRVTRGGNFPAHSRPIDLAWSLQAEAIGAAAEVTA